MTMEQWRWVSISALSPILSFYTPTKGFILALILMFGFNIWAGMRADGVAIVRCRNFSFRKFKNALCELFLYLAIIEVVFTIMVSCNDRETAIIAVKSLTYIFLYVYLQNAFKNLIIAYPKLIALHIIYHVIRLEFTRVLPDQIKDVINHYTENEKNENINKGA